ncbi:MAG: LacI family transcriptional regulator [Treponema sp.]|jgi:DNA-binding LacI/PurR family transcriptional regulator|nr:LacI family transcriptional regulator [Treponema sp.]
MNNKKITTTDIARQAGVSQSTVSMILNRKKNISFSEKTIRRVLETAAELNYQTKTKKPGNSGPLLIAVMVPTLANPYYPALLQIIKAEAAKVNYDLFVYIIRNDEEAEKVTAFLSAMPILGIIYAFMPYKLEPLSRIAENMPVVIIGDKNDDTGIDTIGLNSVESGAMLAEYLLSLGHRNIAFISTPLGLNSLPRKRRLEGVTLALNNFSEKCSLVVRAADEAFSARLHDANAESQLGYELTMKVLQDRKITAFIGVNDMVAFGILSALAEKKYHIPEDYSVCGFDNIFPSAFKNISLTTVEHFIGDKARDAFDILHKKINYRLSGLVPNSIYKIEYKPQLIIRGSSGPRQSREYAQLQI